MNAKLLMDTAKALVADDKGVLARVRKAFETKPSDQQPTNQSKHEE